MPRVRSGSCTKVYAQLFAAPPPSLKNQDGWQFPGALLTLCFLDYSRSLSQVFKAAKINGVAKKPDPRAVGSGHGHAPCAKKKQGGKRACERGEGSGAT